MEQSGVQVLDDGNSKNYQNYLSMQLALITELTFLEFDLTEQFKKTFLKYKTFLKKISRKKP